MSLIMLSLKFLLWLQLLFLSWLLSSCNANQQSEYLYKFIKSRRSQKFSHEEASTATINGADEYFSKVYHVDQQQSGLMEGDKLVKGLPGQPKEGVDFDQYAGYVNVDAKAGRALFYYFVESPVNSSTKPLVLWLNGGPGCSSLGYGAMQELGPFRVNSDGRTLSTNEYAWNNVANVLFLESPAGVGFSYSNTSSDYSAVGDNRTAIDSYTFLLNWLERFPQYKTRDLFITGESYAGYYIPELAAIILSNNNLTANHTVINLKGIAIGNGWIDDNLCSKGMYEYFWTHALISDETHEGIEKNCNIETNFQSECLKYQGKADIECGHLDIYNIYAPLCNINSSAATITGSSPATTYSGSNFDPCSEVYTISYLNLPEVQEALHAKATKWDSCSGLGWADSPTTTLPTIKRIASSGISTLLYSGDTDGRVPITATRYAVNSMNLTVENPWRAWYSDNEVGGYVIGYKGLTLVTVRGAGHMVPSNQPQRALTMISSFLSGQLPPNISD